MHWETKKIHVNHFIVLFALLQWLGTESTVSPRYVCTLFPLFRFSKLCMLRVENMESIEMYKKIRRITAALRSPPAGTRLPLLLEHLHAYSSPHTLPTTRYPRVSFSNPRPAFLLPLPSSNVIKECKRFPPPNFLL